MSFTPAHIPTMGAGGPVPTAFGPGFFGAVLESGQRDPFSSQKNYRCKAVRPDLEESKDRLLSICERGDGAPDAPTYSRVSRTGCENLRRLSHHAQRVCLNWPGFPMPRPIFLR